MRQTGDWHGDRYLSGDDVIELLRCRIDAIDVDQVRREVAPFAKDTQNLNVWSSDFFRSIVDRIVAV
jgi:hypothetical protein